jgi:hypothetical protein
LRHILFDGALIVNILRWALYLTELKVIFKDKDEDEMGELSDDKEFPTLEDVEENSELYGRN